MRFYIENLNLLRNKFIGNEFLFHIIIQLPRIDNLKQNNIKDYKQNKSIEDYANFKINNKVKESLSSIKAFNPLNHSREVKNRYISTPIKLEFDLSKFTDSHQI